MPYVERNQDQKITGAFTAAQPGRAEEHLPEDHPDVVAFFTKPVISKEDAAEQAITRSPEIYALVKALAPHLSISSRKLLDDIRAQAKGA